MQNPSNDLAIQDSRQYIKGSFISVSMELRARFLVDSSFCSIRSIGISSSDGRMDGEMMEEAKVAKQCSVDVKSRCIK
jgi:hypothetical protein